MKHPFDPIFFDNTTKLLIGTLPPENSTFYFSNSTNMRLWDFLVSILEQKEIISKNSILKSIDEKKDILKNLSLGISDIIFEYDRKIINSTKDSDIIPKVYNDILTIITNSKIHTLLFVYENAARWFLHYYLKEKPLPLTKINIQIDTSKDTFLNLIIMTNKLNVFFYRAL